MVRKRENWRDGERWRKRDNREKTERYAEKQKKERSTEYSRMQTILIRVEQDTGECISKQNIQRSLRYFQVFQQPWQ